MMPIRFADECRESLFKRSTVVESGDNMHISDMRTSFSAYLPHNDSVVQCLINRASEFQGFHPVDDIEDLQATRYLIGQEYQHHYDWYNFPNGSLEPSGRVSTIFGILQANCTACMTEFPLLRFDWPSEDPRWCKFVDCERSPLTVRPIEGSAVFWRNLDDVGLGDKRTLHAGLPALDGTKTGFNIWSISHTD